MGRETELAEQLKALGDPLRLRILNNLPHDANCEYGNNVSQIADKLGAPQPTVSHHLRVLRQAGLVRHRKMCRDVFYWINPEASREVLELLKLVFGPLPPPKGWEDDCEETEAGAREGGAE